MKEFQLDIKVRVTGHSDHRKVAPLVADAMQELVNRADFRHGTIQMGRAITHELDFQEVIVTVDIARQPTKDS